MEALREVARTMGIDLPGDYVAFMQLTDGGAGDVGSSWIEFWPVEEILETAGAHSPYDGILLFAGDGANTVYGFDRERDNEIVEGDWIGLRRDQLIPHSRTLTEFLQTLSGSG